MKQTTLFISAISLLGLFLTLSGCGPGPVYRDLTEKGQKCTADSCLVSIYPIGGIYWDQIYIVGEYLTDDLISDYLGVPYEGSIVPDHHYRFLLLKNREVVYEEDISWRNRPTIEFGRVKRGYYAYPQDTSMMLRPKTSKKGRTVYWFMPLQK